MGLHQIKNILYDEAINKMKRTPTKLEKIFANNVSDNRLIFKMYKELIQLNIKKKKKDGKTGKGSESTFFQRRYKIVNMHMKKCSTSLINREKQIETTVRCHFIPVRMVIIKNKQKQIASVSEDTEKREPCVLLVKM